MQTFFDESLSKAITDSCIVERERILDGRTFMEICIYEVLERGLNGSLRNFCQRASKEYGILDFAEESFNGRFNEKSVHCGELLFESILQEKFYNKLNINILNKFKHVYIQDSSVEELNKSLKDLYPGTGGSGNTSAVKLDVSIDLKESESIRMKLKSGKENDNVEKLEVVPQALYLRDLGYFDLQYLAKLEQEKAFYVSRIKCTTHLFTKCEKTGDFIALDLGDLSKKMRENEQREIEVYVGKDQKLKSRLVLKKHPAAVAAEKRRKLKSCPRNKVKNPSKKQLDFCDFSVVITNLDEKDFDGTQIYELYRIRWQIELFFKSWKSYFHLGKVAKVMKAERVMTLLYILLTIILVYHKIVSIEYIYLWNNNKFELSILKGFAICNEHKDLFIKAISKKYKDDFQEYLTLIADDFIRFGQKEVKGKGINNSTFFAFKC